MAEYKLSYTASEIDEKLGKIDDLANKSDIPSKTSELTNDSGFITKSVSDLTNYYDKTRVDEKSVHYIVGDSTTAGVWTGTCADIISYFDGLTIAYKTNMAGVSGGTTLNINSLGAISVRRNATTAVTTTYPVGSVLLLTYSTTDGVGYWLTADYDANTKTTAGSSNKAATKMYLIGGTSQSSSGVTTYSNKNCYIGTDDCLYSNGKKVAEEEDIPTALKNPNALTINGTTYDGSETKDFTSTINSMIDTKIAAIPNASGVSF